MEIFVGGKKMKLLIVCAAGMSSSILVEKCVDAAKSKDKEIEVKAVSMEALDSEKGKWDVCLIGPQVRYMKEKIKNELEIPIEVCDMQAYALADGNKVLDQAEKLFYEQ